MSSEFQTHPSDPDIDNVAQRLELALRASNEGIWDWQVGDEAVYYSDRIYGFFERERGQLPNIFTHPEELLLETEVELFRTELQARLESPGSPITSDGEGEEDDLFAIDCRIISTGTSPRWLRIRGAIVRDATGRATRMAGSMIDISRRKYAESKAEEERHRLRTLVDSVPLSIFFKDAESRFTLVNKRMVEWMGMPDERELLGKTDHDLFSGAHADQALDDEREVMESGTPILDQLEEETWGDKDNTYVQTSKFPLRDRQGQVIGTFGIAADVTELVRTRNQLAEAALELSKNTAAIEEEIGLAREIQQSFANPDDRVKEVHGLRGEADIGTFYLPISGMAGDFYETIAIREGVVGLLICDVMGHGVRSALVVAMLRGLMERERGLVEDPGMYLSSLNDDLSGILNGAGITMFATAFYAVVDLNEGSIRYASAGHPAAIIRSGEHAEALPTDDIQGPALGLTGHAIYREMKRDLSDVDELILFTDGCYEVENDSETPLGESGLVELVSTADHTDVNTFLHGVVDGVMKFSAASGFDDDVCLLALSFQ